MSEHSAEKDAPNGATTEEEWGVRYNDGKGGVVRSFGSGYWGKRHAEQEVERTLHNATLPSVGQPKSAVVVRRIVTRYYDATAWARVFPPAMHPGGTDR